MANIWLDCHASIENYLPFAAAKKEQTQSTRKPKVLGELHNKPLQSDVLPGVFYSASKSLRHDVLRKQQMKQNFQQARQNLEHQLDVKPPAPVPAPTLYTRSDANENLFDYWDVPSVCCSDSCRKTDQQIWSEAILFGDALIDKLLNHTADSDSDYESASDDSIVDFDRSLDVDSILLDTNPLRLLPDDEDTDFTNLSPIKLPICADFSDSDDDLLL